MQTFTAGFIVTRSFHAGLHGFLHDQKYLLQQSVASGALPIKDLSVEWVMGRGVKKRENNYYLE